MGHTLNCLSLCTFTLLVFTVNHGLCLDKQRQVTQETLINLPSISTPKGAKLSFDCPDGHLPLNDLYHFQVNLASLYTNICHLQFVELFKFKKSKEALIFGSIFNSRDNETTANFGLLTQLAALLNKKFIDYRLVIRLNGSHPPSGTLRVKLNNESFLIQFTSSQQEYVLPKLTQKVSRLYTPPSLSVDIHQKPLLSTSYVMVCLSFQKGKLDLEANCTFAIYNGFTVDCYCTTDKRGFIIPLSVLSVAWTIFGLLLLYIWMFAGDEQRDPEVQFALVLCMPGHATFEYLVIFKVGLATEDFNYQHTFIDLQLLGIDDEAVGLTVRYSASNLIDPICSEIHMIICRITPLGTITGVRASHSAQGCLLRIYEMTVINLREENTVKDTVIQEETFQQFISSEPSIIRPLTEEMVKVFKQTGTAHCQLESLLFCLTSTEKIAFTQLVFCLASCLVMLAHTKFYCYVHWKNITQSMGQFGLCFITVAALNWLLLAFLEPIFVFYIKKPYLLERYEQATSSQILYRSWLIRLIFLLTFYVCSLVFSGLTIFFSLSLDLNSTGLWSGMTACVLALSIGAWLLVEAYSFGCIKTQSVTNLDSFAYLSGDWCPPSAFQAVHTINFTECDESQARESMSSLIGPRLLTPKLAHSSIHAKLSSKQIEKACPAYSLFMKSHKSKTSRHRKKHGNHRHMEANKPANKASIPSTTNTGAKQADLKRLMPLQVPTKRHGTNANIQRKVSPRKQTVKNSPTTLNSTHKNVPQCGHNLA